MLCFETQNQEEVESLKEGEVREREPARSPQQQQGQSQQQRSGRQYGQQAFGQGLRSQVPTVGCWRSLAIYSSDAVSMRDLAMVDADHMDPVVRLQPPATASGAAGGRDAEAEKDPLAGTWEKLYLEDDAALVERRDVWVCVGTVSQLPTTCVCAAKLVQAV
jgi:hypothetical protein